MTIDERLESLTARHEALTHTVELIAGMQRETEKAIANIAKEHAKTEKGLNRLRRYAAQIVRDHEIRLSALEDGPDEEENES